MLLGRTGVLPPSRRGLLTPIGLLGWDAVVRRTRLVWSSRDEALLVISSRTFTPSNASFARRLEPNLRRSKSTFAVISSRAFAGRSRALSVASRRAFTKRGFALVKASRQ